MRDRRKAEEIVDKEVNELAKFLETKLGLITSPPSSKAYLAFVAQWQNIIKFALDADDTETSKTARTISEKISFKMVLLDLLRICLPLGSNFILSI